MEPLVLEVYLGEPILHQSKETLRSKSTSSCTIKFSLKWVILENSARNVLQENKFNKKVTSKRN